MLKTMPPSQKDLADLVQRLRSVVEPKRIMLFGSCARGNAHENSDVDVLVIVADEVDLLKANMAAYEAIRGFGYPVDIVYVNESRFARHANTPGFIFRQVVKDGLELYAAAA
jgi:predicted nucleotidyltransferase